MGWWDRLPAETRRDLMRRTKLRRPDAIAALAIENAAFEADFARLNAKVITSPEQLSKGYHLVYKPTEYPIVLFSGSEAQFGDLVVLALEDEAAPLEGLSTATTRGAPAKEYPGAAIEKAVRMWTLRKPPRSQNAIARKTKLSRAAVRRVVRLIDHGALDWDEKRGEGWLGIHGEYRATPESVSLRALEEAHGLAPFTAR